ncbi:MAG TPA: hypothetical protein ENI80_03695 [Acidiferrobacteraceae bacterium]|nr:hypothetical protein [Acidiferrobacteraceae bacterium]
MNKVSSMLIIGITTLFLGACETTAKRVERHQDLFKALSTPHQGLILSGKIQVGFTTDEVFLAWGRPTRKSVSEDGQGQNETWVYTVTRTAIQYYPVHHYQHISYRWRHINEPYYFQYGYVSKDVVFANGQVSAWAVYTPPVPLRDY